MRPDGSLVNVAAAGAESYGIAPMSTGIRVLTVLLLAVPVAMAAGALAGSRVLLVPLALAIAVYAWIWLLFRPRAFVIQPGSVEIVWPLKRLTIPRSSIVSCRTIGVADLRREIGWGVRVGAGGLW